LLLREKKKKDIRRYNQKNMYDRDDVFPPPMKDVARLTQEGESTEMTDCDTNVHL
jgi:hypothetical protein